MFSSFRPAATGDAVKESNAVVSDILVKTKRFPAITCYAPGTPLRFFAQIENVPQDITAEKLAGAVEKLTARKDQAEVLFKKAAALKGSNAADSYGAAFDKLMPMVGQFHRDEIIKGKCGWSDEWKALSALDANDSFGWVKHFEIDDYKGVAMVEKVTAERKDGSTAFFDGFRRIPTLHFSASQRQLVKIMEYAATTDGTDKPIKPEGKAALKAALELGRSTFWGQYALGRLMMDGEKYESKGLPHAAVRPRPDADSRSEKPPFALEQLKGVISKIKPTAALNEQQKLAVARHAVLRLIGQKGWDDLVSRPGSALFVKAFMNDRAWLEDFAWSGTFPANSSDGWARAGDGPGDGAAAVLALESLVFQDNGRWVPFADGAFMNNEGRRFMTALALNYPDKDEAWLADVLDAYRATAKAGRLHKSAYSQPVWIWRFALHQGHGTASARQVREPAEQGVWRCVLDDTVSLVKLLWRFRSWPALLQAVGDCGRMAEKKVFADRWRRVRRALEVRKRSLQRPRAPLDYCGAAGSLRLHASTAERSMGGRLQRNRPFADASLLLEQAPLAVFRLHRKDVSRRPREAPYRQPASGACNHSRGAWTQAVRCGGVLSAGLSLVAGALRRVEGVRRLG